MPYRHTIPKNHPPKTPSRDEDFPVRRADED